LKIKERQANLINAIIDLDIRSFVVIDLTSRTVGLALKEPKHVALRGAVQGLCGTKYTTISLGRKFEDMVDKTYDGWQVRAAYETTRGRRRWRYTLLNVAENNAAFAAFIAPVHAPTHVENVSMAKLESHIRKEQKLERELEKSNERVDVDTINRQIDPTGEYRKIAKLSASDPVDPQPAKPKNSRGSYFMVQGKRVDIVLKEPDYVGADEETKPFWYARNVPRQKPQQAENIFGW
jgi:hypothetical protein